MSLGRRIAQLRRQTKMTQRQVSASTGLAVSYLSRVENGRITPSIRTLSKIAKGLGTTVASFLDGSAALEPGDECPVSPSGRCILDQAFVSSGRRDKGQLETYSARHLDTLRMCNLLLLTRDPKIATTLSTVMKAFLALGSSKGNFELPKDS